MIKHHGKVMCAMEMILYLARTKREVTTGEIRNHLAENSHDIPPSGKAVLSCIDNFNETFPKVIKLHKADSNTTGSNDRNFYYISINTMEYNRLIDSVIYDSSIPSSVTHNFGVETNDNLYLTFRVLQIILEKNDRECVSYRQIESITQCSHKQIYKIVTNLENLIGGYGFHIEGNNLVVNSRNAIIKKIKA
jgi:hypothetical protein